MTDTDLREYLAENPRMIGVLFMLTLLLSQAGNAMGAFAYTIRGP
ncbi:hypothetical protein ACFQH6_08370 [Halobacteriaceae archaeon GCM10025711]